LTAAEKSRGIIAASAGNHAQGVALAAKLIGVRATVFMPDFASIAKIRIESKPNIELLLGDSSAKFTEALNSVPGGFFAYLDAHWGTKLPLGAELRALERRTDYVCMIDDFEVADTEYGFDEYEGIRIGIKLLREMAPWLKRVFVPAYPPSASGELRRGYCVFGRGDSARPIGRVP
jgi:hypothetical protein